MPWIGLLAGALIGASVRGFPGLVAGAVTGLGIGLLCASRLRRRQRRAMPAPERI